VEQVTFSVQTVPLPLPPRNIRRSGLHEVNHVVCDYTSFSSTTCGHNSIYNLT